MKITEITKDTVTIEFDRIDVTKLQPVFEDAEGCAGDRDDAGMLATTMRIIFELAFRSMEGVESDWLREGARERNEGGGNGPPDDIPPAFRQ